MMRLGSARPGRLGPVACIAAGGTGSSPSDSSRGESMAAV